MPTPFLFPADFADSPTAISTPFTIGGVTYVFRFWPNTRANDGKGAWYVDLFNVLGTPTLLDIKLVLSTDLFGFFRTSVAQIPPGRIVVRRTDSVRDEPRPTRKGEIGSRVATLGSPLLVVEYVSVTEDPTFTTTSAPGS